MKYVILYTMEGCPHCVNFKNMLKEGNIKFEERNIENYEEEYKNFVEATSNDYLPAFTLINIENKNDPQVELYAPDDDFENLNEAVEIINNFLI